jgi:hypothetical protein
LGNGNLGVAIGHEAKMNDTGSVAIGANSCGFYPGIVSIGYLAGDGNALRDSVNIGKQARSAGYGAIAMGATASACSANAIAIGTSAKVLTSSANSIAIGNLACVDTTAADAIAIGSCAYNYAPTSVVIGTNVCNYDSSRLKSIVIGSNMRAAQCAIAIGNDMSGGAGLQDVAIGNELTINSGCGVNIGYRNCIQGYVQATTIGFNNCSTGLTGAVILGNNLTSIKQDTTHVQSLVAFGQGASLTNDIGSVTGTATINWDNSNNQSITLIGSTTLTFSNPLSGANYQIEITQGGVGSYTITWPTIKWMNATSPTLSTVVGRTDIVSLYYDGTNYYGTFALNFA